MITTSGLRNAFWFVVAFAIVAGASAPAERDSLLPNGDAAIQARPASGT
jgi:hypothetical protein